MELVVSIASSDEARRAVYRQRYRSYVHEGALNASPSEIFTDNYDDLSTSVLVSVSDDSSEIVGSLRFSVQPPNVPKHNLPVSCPEFLIFPEALEELAKDNRPIASGSRFSIEPNHKRRTHIALLLLLAEAKAAKAVRAKWGIATARGSHLKMYNRFLLKEICSPRRMPGLNYDYALLASNIDTDFPHSLGKFPTGLVQSFERANPQWEKNIVQQLDGIEGAENWLPSF